MGLLWVSHTFKVQGVFKPLSFTFHWALSPCLLACTQLQCQPGECDWWDLLGFCSKSTQPPPGIKLPQTCPQLCANRAFGTSHLPISERINFTDTTTGRGCYALLQIKWTSSYCTKESFSFSYPVPVWHDVCFNWGRRDRRGPRWECHRFTVLTQVHAFLGINASHSIVCLQLIFQASDWLFVWILFIFFFNFVQFYSCFLQQGFVYCLTWL